MGDSHGASLSPQRADGVGLSQLDDDGPGAQLVAGVARVPVVVARVAVEQGVSAAAHALDDAGARRHGGHVLAGDCEGRRQRLEPGSDSEGGMEGRWEGLTHEAVLQRVRAVGEHALESHQVEDLVDRVVRSHDADVPAKGQRPVLVSVFTAVATLRRLFFFLLAF